MKRLLATVVFVVTLLTACADDEPLDASEQFAADVISQVDAALGAQTTVAEEDIVVPEGCSLVIEVDEYGFEVEIVRCPDTVVGTTEPSTGSPVDDVTASTVATSGDLPLGEWLGSVDARNLARRLRNGLIMQTGCGGDLTELMEADDLAAAAPEEVRSSLREAIAALQGSALACNADPDTWLSELNAALDAFGEFTMIVEEYHSG